MSGFLANLVGRSFSLVPVVQPRLAHRFEPVAEASEPATDTIEAEGSTSGIRYQPHAPDSLRAATILDEHAGLTGVTMGEDRPMGDAHAQIDAVHRPMPLTTDARPSLEQMPFAHRAEVGDRPLAQAVGRASIDGTGPEPEIGLPDLMHITSEAEQKPDETLEARTEPHASSVQAVAFRPAVHPLTRDAGPSVSPVAQDVGQQIELSEGQQTMPGLSEAPTPSPLAASPEGVASPRLPSLRSVVEPTAGSTESTEHQSPATPVEAAAGVVPADMSQPSVKDTAEPRGVFSPAPTHVPGRGEASESPAQTTSPLPPPGARILPANPEVSPRPVQRTPDPTPTIRVTIGRIEVHAETETPPPTRRSARPSPRVSLDDYLRSQDRRQR